MVWSFLTTVLFSMSAVCGQRAARLLGGTEANFWRLALGTLVLGLIAHSLGGGMAGAAFPMFLLSGCVGFGIGDLALYQALPRLGSRLSMVLVLCLSSPIGALAEWLWLRTVLSAAEIGWAVVILTGVALALSPGKHLDMNQRQWLPGITFGLVASICQALGAVLSRKAFAIALAAQQPVDGMTAAYQRILGGTAIAAVAILIVKRRELAHVLFDQTGQPEPNAAQEARWPRAWHWVFLNSLSGSVLGVSCFQWALKTTPTGVVLPIVAITPLVIIPFSRYIEGERPTWRSLAGGFIAVIGAVGLALSR